MQELELKMQGGRGGVIVGFYGIPTEDKNFMYPLLFPFSLTVCFNSIGDEGLCSLADTLRIANFTLTHAHIWGNRIGEPTCNVSWRQKKAAKI